MTTIRAVDALFEGAVSYDRTSAGIAPVRLPVAQAALFPSPNETLMDRAYTTSGVRLRFASDSTTLVLHLEPQDTSAEPRIFDLTTGGELLTSLEVPPGAGSVTIDLPRPAQHDLPVYELWLHQFHPARIRALEIDDGSEFAIPPDRRLRWLTYGSSITMCRTAASPARTWPAVAARIRGLNLTSLGFGGQCHIDPMVARVIRDQPADIITLKLGINVYGASSLSARTYTGAVIALVQIIRERHPATPIGVITSIVSPDKEATPNAVGCTLENYREMTRDAVSRLTAAGDTHTYLFEGTQLFGAGDVDLLPDGVHPNAEGYERIGRRVAELVLPDLVAAREAGRG